MGFLKKIKSAVLISAAVFLIGVLGFLLWKIFPGTRLRLPSFDRVSADLIELSKRVAAPAPLVSKEEYPEARLTRQGILDWTNYFRKQGGIAPLAVNARLDSAAEAKLRDMEEKQYFEHISPTGAGPDALAVAAGYDYILIGENLAVGNFKDDKTLLDAWMASPGHRANIMNPKYIEIGIAAAVVQYEGRSVWMAVQEFGLPKSACPFPNQEIKAQIAEYEKEIADIEAQILILRSELSDKNARRNVEEYNRKVDEYNALVLEYKSLADAINAEADKYNAAVRKFNSCAGE